MQKRGRPSGSEGPLVVSRWNATVVGVMAGLIWATAGCGGLSNPDFTTGQVTGRLTGTVQPGAFAYALGAPETKTAIAADGTYTVSGVPVGSAQIVLFNGVDRADKQPVEVKPASRAYAPDRAVTDLALARTVFVAARCTGGVSGANTVYEVEGAALATDPTGDVATLYPLPPGQFKVYAALAGFYPNSIDVDLSASASAQIEFDMDVNDDTPGQQGCLANNSCTGGLYCAPDDGRCYVCIADGNCAANQKCLNHVCTDNTLRAICATCTTASWCSAGPGATQTSQCIPETAPATGSVCSYGCGTSADCPSGYACTGGACVTTSGCAARSQEFGKTCLGSTAATDCAALADPVCKGSGSGGSGSGYCTSRCTTSADCPANYTCDAEDLVCEH